MFIGCCCCWVVVSCESFLVGGAALVFPFMVFVDIAFYYLMTEIWDLPVFEEWCQVPLL